MLKPKGPNNIFVSYSRADAPKLKMILEDLTSKGILSVEDQIVHETDLPSSHRSAREEVKRQIQSASKVVVVWGPSSANSQWVNYEIGLADAFGKPIVAVVSTDDSSHLPATLQKFRVIKISH